jgi:FAD/FMN-containing dehydrogenase
VGGVSTRGPRLIVPGDPDYDGARRIWNLTYDRRPMVIARCADADDVVAALAMGTAAGMRIAVRGGGHSYAGHSVCDGGMVIDLRDLTGLRVDPERGTVTVGPGLTWGAVTEAVGQHGLVPVGGHVSTVGVAGSTLGGGNGWLSRRYGLACDNMVEAEVVTAAGEIVTVGPDAHPDLWWGLRGGGGNFGIAVSFTLRLHPAEPMLAGMLLYPGDRAAEVLRFVGEFGAAAADETSVLAAIATAPPAPFVPPELVGRVAVLVAACHAGPVPDAERALAPLREFGPPAADLLAPMPYSVVQHMFDPMVAEPMPYYMRSHLTGPLDAGLADVLAEHGAEVTSPMSAVLMVPMGGTIPRAPAGDSAVAHRDASYVLEIGAGWPSPDDDPRPHREWADRLWQATQPWSVGNEVNHQIDDSPQGVLAAYGEEIHARLATLKSRWDPGNVFSLNLNIPPTR